MCSLIIELAMLVMGIVALSKGKIKFSPNRFVTGATARLVAVILMLPMATSLIVGMTIARRGREASDGVLLGWAVLIEVLTMVLCGLFAVIVGGMAAKPPPEAPRRDNSATFERNQLK